MNFVEAGIEGIHDTRTEAARAFVSTNTDKVMDYMGLLYYSKRNRSRMLFTIESLKKIIIENGLATAFCNRRYVYLLREIKANGRKHRADEGVMEMWYEFYLEVTKKMAEDAGEALLALFSKESEEEVICAGQEGEAPPCRKNAWLQTLLESIESQYMVDLFVSFFALQDGGKRRWMAFLQRFSVVEHLFECMQERARERKEYQNISKLVSILVSFTGTVIRERTVSAEMHFLDFYVRVDGNMETLLRLLFLERDHFNRNSLLEIVKSVLYKLEAVGGLESSLFRELGALLTGSLPENPLNAIRGMKSTNLSLVRVSILIDLVTRSVKFRSPALKQALEGVEFVGQLFAYYLKMPDSALIARSLYFFVLELVNVDRLFYHSLLVSLCREVRASLKVLPREGLAESYRGRAAHFSLHDSFTPIVSEMKRLRELSMFESRRYPHRGGPHREMKQRFFTVDKTSKSHELVKELSFMDSDEWRWYSMAVLGEYERRMRIEYVREGRDRVTEINEQFARYICGYVANRLPHLDKKYFG